MEELIQKIKQKKEFSKIPDSLVEKILGSIKETDEHSKIKEARHILRKILSAFLTNKVLSQRLEAKERLKKHYSTKNKDYNSLYKKILGNEKSIIDLGAGINGLSFSDILKFSNKDVEYVGVEAIGQLVDIMNDYFQKNNFNAKAINGDLFELESIIKTLKKLKQPRTVFMFNVIDALESVERDFSKGFILEISKSCEKVVLSFPTKTIGKRISFVVKRNWIIDFIHNKFRILDDFEMNGERFLIFRNV